MSSLTTARPDADDDLAPPRANRALRIAVIVAVVGLLAVFGTWLVAFSPVLGVGGVAVHGTKILSAAEVRRAADVTEDTPLVRVDTAAITRRVAALPEVASVQVETSFPSTVDITVVERQAVAFLRTGDGDQLDALLDRTGFPFRTVHARPAGLPVIDIGGGSGTAAVRAGVAEVAASLPAGLRAKVRSIQALDPTAITLLLEHGRVVTWGSATRNADKARVVTFLLGRNGNRINVTDPDRPFTRR